MTTANVSRDEAGNLTIKQGTTASWAYAIKQGAAAVDTTGWSAAMHFRESYDSRVPLLTCTTANGKFVNHGATGLFVASLLPADTSAINFKGEALEGVYDVEVTDTTGYVWRIAAGSITLLREVTR